MVFVLFVAGIILLVAGAEALVRGASRLAGAVGITPLVIGLTVVAFGTSAPELTVSVVAALQGAAGTDVALGNVVGSNIFNILFILGLSACVTPLMVAQKLVRFDVPLLILLSILVFALALDGRVGRGDGIVLFAGIILYTGYAIWEGRREQPPLHPPVHGDSAADPPAGPAARLWVQLALIVGGLALLVVGSRWLVDGAITMAQALGVSELIISLTIVAAGTSLPEVATSLMASIRGERDIAVGNVVGSCIFNLLAVLGVSATVSPGGIGVSQAALGFDLPVMTAAAVVCLPIFFTGYRIGRIEGLLFLGYYLAYVAYLILASTQHDALTLFGETMMFIVMPATAIFLAVTLIRHRVRKRQDGVGLGDRR